MKGTWVFICGSSGAGKDSVIGAAREILQAHTGIIFSRRMVTRPVQPGSDHDPVSETDFQNLVHTAQLSWHWSAHGYGYGIAGHYAAEVQAGRVVVVNGSRAHVNQLAPSPAVRVVQITADAARLATRLESRGRDAAGAIAERLTRNALFTEMQAQCVIVNNGPVEAAGRLLADYLAGPSLVA